MCNFAAHALTLEAGQATQSLKEKVQAKADKDISQLQDELKRKTEELEAVKTHHANTESDLIQTTDDAKSK